MEMNRQIRLISRPIGMPQRDNFDFVDSPIPELPEGSVVAKNLFLSVDPYMRGRMDEGRSYLPPIPINGVVNSRNIARVIASKNNVFRPNDLVVGYGAWEDFSLYSGSSLMRVDTDLAKPEAFLGVLGSPGCTAYVGVVDIGQPKPDETFVVSAASGPVGSVAGQIAKIKGARVVGIAGGPEKCRYVVDELGFDACVDHRGPHLPEALAEACPQGIDVDFENVGGAVLDAIWPLLNDHARVPLCGMISGYNESGPKRGPDFMMVLKRRLKIEGFLVTERFDRFPEFLREMSQWVGNGKIKHREHIFDGLDSAPDALIALLSGRNFGKVVVRLAE
jgi:NADPH-dependent curcumin reductase CurA